MASLKEPGKTEAGTTESGKEAAQQHAEERTTGETLHDAATSHDRPMERKKPQVPFALVGLSYLAILAVIGLIIGIVLFALS